jgi:hypothetical protein
MEIKSVNPTIKVLKRDANLQQTNSKLTYSDIMKSMGIYEYNNKLYFIDPNTHINTPMPIQINESQKYMQNSYIYNKYFKNQLNDNISQTNKPKNIYEYRDLLIRNIIEKHKINTIKTTKIKIPTDTYVSNNFHNNENKLFNWLKK